MCFFEKVLARSSPAEARDYPQGINVDRKAERARQQYKLGMTERLKSREKTRGERSIRTGRRT